VGFFAAVGDEWAASNTVMATAKALLTTMLGVQDAVKNVEEALQQAGLGQVDAFTKEVKKAHDDLMPALQPLRAVGDIFKAIAQALQFLR
jgi:hypothetical protein